MCIFLSGEKLYGMQDLFRELNLLLSSSTNTGADMVICEQFRKKKIERTHVSRIPFFNIHNEVQIKFLFFFLY